MDKKNTFIGVVLLVIAFGLMFWQGKVSQELSKVEYQQLQRNEENTQPRVLASQGFVHIVEENEKSLTNEEKPSIAEQFYTLENDDIRVRFTNYGGAIKDIELKKFPARLDGEESFTFNTDAALPALAIAINEGDQQFAPAYKLLRVSENMIQFMLELEEGLQVIRGYKIAKGVDAGDPYLILHENRFLNKSDKTFDLKHIFINVGSFPPTKGDTLGEYLNFGHYNGKSADFIRISKFHDSKGFLGIGKSKGVSEVKSQDSNVVWASVKNQFFASVLTPDQPGTGYFVKPVELGKDDEGTPIEGLAGSLQLNLGRLGAGEESLLGMKYYVGPKEFSRLENMGQNQDLIMQFGFFEFISKLLLSMMIAIHSFIPNWGLTIIMVTVIIKLLLWPLTNAQVRSSKRMAKLQEPMKALKEKYKDNPQKLQAETMRLFKENKVNPAAGCLPLLVQLPIFLGLYFMLRTSSELRFATFLWIPDLSVPDTIAMISGFPVNILPLIMGVSMFFQMRMMPSPTTDNAQRKIFQWMPFIFLIFCYNFPSGLVLYWTVQNMLSILQQVVTNRNVEVEVVASPVKAGPKLKKKKKLKV